MNKIRLIGAALLTLIVVGCASQMTTFSNTAGKFLASTAITVDGAMVGWSQYVKTGQATPQDEVLVKTTYEKYQSAMMVATNAYAVAVKFSDPTLFTGPSNNVVAAQQSLSSSTAKSTIKQ